MTRQQEIVCVGDLARMKTDNIADLVESQGGNMDLESQKVPTAFQVDLLQSGSGACDPV